MKLLIVSEGKHELGGALETIVRRLTRVDAEYEMLKVSDPSLRVHHGKGGGYFKKAVRCLIYAAERGFDALVLLIDQDKEPDRRRQLSEAQVETRLSRIPRALGVAVIEFDAWMLADERALTKVLGRPVLRLPNPEDMKDPKRACIELRDESGTNLALADLYTALANEIDLELLVERCPTGFGPFAQRAIVMGMTLRS